MRRKVLLVDDAPEVLCQLQRLLQPLTAEWDLTFVDSAAAALSALAQAPFDVLATDMVMPRMDGLELLTEVKGRYPGLVRIAFSGEPDKKFGLRSAGLAHQFLEKPLDAGKLQSIMTRACALQAALTDEQLRRSVIDLRNLPSLPAIYRELMEEIHSRDASLKKIAKIISRDLAMVSKLLQLVNSAFFGLRTTVSNPEQAVALLGTDTIKSLVLSMQVFSQFEAATLPGLSMEALWRHGLGTGASARRIACEEGAPQSMTDDAFAAGLLHDVGRLVLALNRPVEYARVQALQRDGSLPDWEAEQAIFGTTHAEVGAHLLSLWGLGEGVVEAVAFHHRPALSATREFTALAAVHVADSWDETQTGGGGSTVLQPNEEFLSQTGLKDRVSTWREASQAA